MPVRKLSSLFWLWHSCLTSKDSENCDRASAFSSWKDSLNAADICGDISRQPGALFLTIIKFALNKYSALATLSYWCAEYTRVGGKSQAKFQRDGLWSHHRGKAMAEIDCAASFLQKEERENQFSWQPTLCSSHRKIFLRSENNISVCTGSGRECVSLQSL